MQVTVGLVRMRQAKGCLIEIVNGVLLSWRASGDGLR